MGTISAIPSSKNFTPAAGAVQDFSVDYAAIYNQPAGTPGAFEEAGIDVHDVTGMASFSKADEPPNIDILVVTNITERDPGDDWIHTLLGQENGTINHPSIKKPRYLDLGPERRQLYRRRRGLRGFEDGHWPPTRQPKPIICA